MLAYQMFHVNCGYGPDDERLNFFNEKKFDEIEIKIKIVVQISNRYHLGLLNLRYF